MSVTSQTKTYFQRRLERNLERSYRRIDAQLGLERRDEARQQKLHIYQALVRTIKFGRICPLLVIPALAVQVCVLLISTSFVFLHILTVILCGLLLIISLVWWFTRISLLPLPPQ
jgi:Flp pilus assembly protein TadB